MALSRTDYLQTRSELLDRIRQLTRQPLMRGSLVERLRRCGKTACACATDDDARHPGLFFTVHLDGSTQAVHVRPNDEVLLREALDGYARLWEIVNDLTRIELRELKRASGERRRQRRKSKS